MFNIDDNLARFAGSKTPFTRFSPQKYSFFCIYANKKCKFRQKPALFFSLVCYSRLLSVGRLVLLRSVYLHAEGNKRALAHYTPKACFFASPQGQHIPHSNDASAQGARSEAALGNAGCRAGICCTQSGAKKLSLIERNLSPLFKRSVGIENDDFIDGLSRDILPHR